MYISLKDFSVAYGDTTAVDGISIDFPEGSTGLLGVNGAGKTSLIKALLGLVPFSAQHAGILGRNVRREGKLVRQGIGYMPENDCLIQGLNGIGMVQYAGELCGMSRTDALQRAHEVLYYVGLEEARYRKVETFSAGMRQRIKLAQAIVHDPGLLFLDEPTTGMDPGGREEMLELIRDISSRKDIGVILSSHILRDVERTCDNVVILHRGRVVGEGSIAELKGRHGESFSVRVEGDRDGFIAALQAAECTVQRSEKFLIDVSLPRGSGTDLILRAADDSGVQLRRLTPGIRSLEDVFVKIIGEEMHADL
jgi:ABC-2 type transport system ATP-binding protein